MYPVLKQVHVACVVLSLTGFSARGVLMATGSSLLQSRFLRIAPAAPLALRQAELAAARSSEFAKSLYQAKAGGRRTSAFA